MKKRHIWTRLLCLALAMAMCLSVTPVAFAAETIEGQVMVETEAGSHEQIDVTISIDTIANPDGSTTTQTTTEANDFVTEKELVVDYNASSTTLTDSGGTIIQGEVSSQYTVDGSENDFIVTGGSEATVTPVAPELEVDVPMTEEDDPSTEEKENQNTETTQTPAGTIVDVSGDVKTDEEDGEYDYTVTIVDKPGSVTVTTENITITENTDSENSDLDYVSSDTTPDGTNDLILELPSLAPEEYLPGAEETPEPPEEPVDGYEFIYTGTGNTSQFRPAVIFTEALTPEQKVEQFGNDPRSGAYIHSTYYTKTFVNWLNEEYRNTVAKTEDGQFVTDEEGFILDIYGNRVLKEEKVVKGPDGETYYLHRFDNLGSSMNVEGWYEDGEWVKELNGSDKYGVVYSTAQQFVLVDQKTGEVVTVYCADISTYTENGFGYTVENLEDADYYSEEQAKQIRSIAMNGYWGAVGYKTDADGNTVLDEAGNPVPKTGSMEALKATLLASGKFTEEELTSLTDGVALTATQMAIWSCSNHMQGTQFINTHYVGEIGATEVDKGGSNYMHNVPEAKEAEAKLMFKLYEFLKSLEPTTYEDNQTTANTIINEQNFLKDMSVTVLDKAEDHANNQDADSTNDAYVTNLTFALVVTPSTENGDDLVVSVVDKNGNVIASGRIAGEAQEGENVLTPDAEGNYSFTGITLVEGLQNFNITLDGIQNLSEGVYLYSSEVRTEDDGDEVTSQTMVGLASGIRDVNVSMNIVFDVSVEDEIIVKEHIWREEHLKPSGDTPPEGNSKDGSGDPEEVILAKPPKTGDGSLLYSILSALSGMGLGALQLLKKRKHPVVAKEVQADAQEAPPAPPKAQTPTQEQKFTAADASAPSQKIQEDEMPAAAASETEPAETGTGNVEASAKEVEDAEVPVGKTAADHGGDFPGRLTAGNGKGRMRTQPIVTAEIGTDGGTSPGIVCAPANGANTVAEKTLQPFFSGGGFRQLFRKPIDVALSSMLRLLSPAPRKKPRPVLLQ